MNPWLVVCALALGPCIANGFARFGYGLILPAMQSSLGWTYTTAGWINTANNLGYLIGSIMALYLGKRIKLHWLYSSGILAASVSLLLTGFTAELTILSILRITAGIGGARALISGAALAANMFNQDMIRNANAIIIYFCGSGFGLFVCSIVLPVQFEIAGFTSWPYSWLWMGGMSLVFCLPSIKAANSVPVPGAYEFHGSARIDDNALENDSVKSMKLPTDQILMSLLGYFFYSIGYIVYITFFGAWLKVHEAKVSTIASSWIVLSIATLIAPLAWKNMLALRHNGTPMALAMLVTAVGAVMPFIHQSWIVFFLSALVFGAAFMIVPTAITVFTRKNLPPVLWGTTFALYTTFFAFGQTIGPIASGWISDVTHGLENGMLFGAAIIIVGSLCAFSQKVLRQGKP